MYVKSIKAEGSTLKVVPASQPKLVVTKAAAPVPVDGRDLFRMDFYLGKIAITSGVKVGMEHSNGHSIWTTTKETTVTPANAGTAITSQASGVFTAAGHGLSVDQQVVFSATTVPAGIDGSKTYRVTSVTTNTFSVIESYSNKIPTVTDAGTAAFIVPVVQFSITFQAAVSGDQSYLPLQNVVRGYVTTGASDSVQVVDVKITPGL
jgi:hypothetical protein